MKYILIAIGLANLLSSGIWFLAIYLEKPTTPRTVDMAVANLLLTTAVLAFSCARSRGKELDA